MTAADVVEWHTMFNAAALVVIFALGYIGGNSQ